MIWVIIWVICGFIGGAIADSKGEGCAGFILGLLFGPIGIIIALLLPSNPKAMGMKQCPYCKEWINSQAIKCPKCQSDLRPKCPYCNTPVNKENKFCPSCGHELPPLK